MREENLYRAYPILKKMNEKSKNQIETQLSFKTLQEGEFLRGVECPGLIFIIKGVIKVEKIDAEGRQTHLYEIKSGEVCHQSLSCHMKCELLEIVGCALVETEVAILPRELIDQYLIGDLEFMHYVYKNLYNKFKMIIEHKEAIIHESIEERVVKYLKKKGSQIIYATHQEIALEVGTSREVVSRKLKELEREGVIELGRGKIKIKEKFESK